MTYGTSTKNFHKLQLPLDYRYMGRAAYCYRMSCVVCLSVSLTVTVVSPAKTAEVIEMPFGLWDQVA